MSGAGGTHTVPIVAGGVIIVCIEHTSSWPQVLFDLVTGSSLSHAHSFELLLAHESAYLPRVLCFSVYRTLPGRMRF